MLPLKFRHILLVFLLPLFVYLSLYTWNWKTGHLDRMARYTGLEFVGSILSPGKWIHRRVSVWLDSYLYLQDVHEENKALRAEIHDLKLEMMRLQKHAQETIRLRKLMDFSPPAQWTFQGADIIGSQVGPSAVLNSLLINKGAKDGITPNTPILTPDGVIGRVRQVSPHFSTVLLITDPNSSIPVRGRRSRTNGVLCGQGARTALQLKHVPQNSPLYESEVLVTSGLAGLFPKGLPVASVDTVEVSDLSLFKNIKAQPLVAMDRLEEVLALHGPPSKSPPNRKNSP